MGRSVWRFTLPQWGRFHDLSSAVLIRQSGSDDDYHYHILAVAYLLLGATL